ncbi:hypothetical protein [Kangiella sp.]|uniref:hypothetical protein n=1 Tax=Kangiella sp. TaxID=1920245 RepID=UPI0019882C81|nr:hypothetical protein [Kangiella sp.]MBD3653860.1 hypothetical protein [Kangiella sp.]
MSSVKDYMWNTICMPDLHPELKGMLFKLEQWPDFGRLTYNQNFIDLCALLSTRYVSLGQLKAFAGSNDDTIHHLLNTLKASNLLSIRPGENTNTHGSKELTWASYKQKLMSFIRSAYRKTEQLNANAA